MQATVRNAAPARRARRARKTVAPLAEVLQYKNDRVVRKFLQQYEIPPREARLLFRETLKFLWLSTRKPNVMILHQMLMLDEMWHTFVLFSSAYEDFCMKYFGRMVHHFPAVKGDPRPPRDDDAELDALIGLVYDELGKATAIRWFETFAQRYTAQYVESRRIAFDGTRQGDRVAAAGDVPSARGRPSRRGATVGATQNARRRATRSSTP
jgi:hypothetical protein